MKLIVTSLFRAIVTQFHPRMLWLAVWPFLVAVVAWGGVGFLERESGLSALHDLLFGLALTRWIEGAFRLFGIEGALVVVVPVLYVALLLAAAIVTALLIIGLEAMPRVVEHIAQRDYPDLVRREGGSQIVGIGNALFALLVFLIGWIVTMPLWLVVPLAVIVPWFWWAWLNARIFRYDALVQHATAEERRTLYREHRSGFFIVGLCVAALNFIPPLFFFAPIFGGIAFTHYALAALKNLRRSRELLAAEAPSGTADAIPPHRMITADAQPLPLAPSDSQLPL